MTQGQRIKRIRQSLSLSQDDFGKIFNIPKQMVSSLENDKLRLNNEKLVKLLYDYNVNINFLLSGKGEMFISNLNNTPGSRISDIQDKTNLSSHKMAEMLNISETELSDIISDKILPDLRVLQNLKKHFKVSMDYIMDGE